MDQKAHMNMRAETLSKDERGKKNARGVSLGRNVKAINLSLIVLKSTLDYRRETANSMVFCTLPKFPVSIFIKI